MRIDKRKMAEEKFIPSKYKMLVAETKAKKKNELLQSTQSELSSECTLHKNFNKGK